MTDGSNNRRWLMRLFRKNEINLVSFGYCPSAFGNSLFDAVRIETKPPFCFADLPEGRLGILLRGCGLRTGLQDVAVFLQAALSFLEH